MDEKQLRAIQNINKQIADLSRALNKLVIAILDIRDELKKANDATTTNTPTDNA